MSLRGFFAALLLSTLLATPSAAAEWTPHAYAGASTIELRTVAAGEGEHWFPVWVVVIDDQVYIRLGPRAAGRIEKNQAAPYLGVRILGAAVRARAHGAGARRRRARGEGDGCQVLERPHRPPLLASAHAAPGPGARGDDEGDRLVVVTHDA